MHVHEKQQSYSMYMVCAPCFGKSFCKMMPNQSKISHINTLPDTTHTSPMLSLALLTPVHIHTHRPDRVGNTALASGCKEAVTDSLLSVSAAVDQRHHDAVSTQVQRLLDAKPVARPTDPHDDAGAMAAASGQHVSQHLVRHGAMLGINAQPVHARGSDGLSNCRRAGRDHDAKVCCRAVGGAHLVGPRLLW